MPFSYTKLWSLLETEQITKDELRNKIGASQTTIVKMGRNENVSLDVIDRICNMLYCKPEDILEYIPPTNSNEDNSILKRGDIYWAYFPTDDSSLPNYIPVLLYLSNMSLYNNKNILVVPLSHNKKITEEAIIIPSDPTSTFKIFQSDCFLLFDKTRFIRRMDLREKIATLPKSLLKTIDSEITSILGINASE